jgi:hypothetical protein
MKIKFRVQKLLFAKQDLGDDLFAVPFNAKANDE